MTFVYVTHDQEEALTMSDRIAVFNQGQDRADRHARRDVRASGDGVRRRVHRHVEHHRARRAARSRSARRRSGSSRGRRGGGGAGSRSGPTVYLGPVDEVRRRARRGRRADGGAAEPRDVRSEDVHRDGGEARPALAGARTWSSQSRRREREADSLRASWRSRRSSPRSPSRRRGVVEEHAPCRRRSAKGEGKLTLVAWEGYTEKQWVAPFEKQTGCKVTAKYAGSSNDMFNLMTSGGGGQYDMVSASGDASLRLIYAGARRRGQRQADPGVQGLLQGVPVAAAQHGRREALRHLAAVRAERADVQHEGVPEDADELGRDLRPEEQGQDHDPGQPDPDRRRGALPLEDEAVARDQGPVRADEAAARRGRRAAEAAAAAHQEVLGARLRPDRPVQERRLDDRRLVAVSGQHAEGGEGAGRGRRSRRRA